MLATKPTKSHYSEIEAAEALGISIDQFRTLVRAHIMSGEEDTNSIASATYQPSDLVILRLLGNLPQHWGADMDLKQ